MKIFPRASQVIKALQKLIDIHGDLPVCLDDPDSGYKLKIGVIYRKEKNIEELPERLEILANYEDKPEGEIKP